MKVLEKKKNKIKKISCNRFIIVFEIHCKVADK
jgi:hypothetical protein